MAKHRFQRTRSTQATHLLVLAALVLVWGGPRIWAGQQFLPNALPGAETGLAAEQTRGKVAPGRPANTPAERKTTAPSPPVAEGGRRDPFKLPPEPVLHKATPEGIIQSESGAVLPAGPRGLLISKLKLQGVVREQTANKMIAVVTNESKRAYFLTENESLYNGVVSKITPDAVYFKENVLDTNGRVTTREVVKRLNPAPGEGR